MTCNSVVNSTASAGRPLLLWLSLTTIFSTLMTPTAAVVNTNCDLEDYYFGLMELDRSSWTRDDLEDLLSHTHSHVTPFIAPVPGTDDVLAALIEMDAVGENTVALRQFSAAQSSNARIHLFYSENATASLYPLDRTQWVPEHICPIFMFEIVPEDFDAAYSDLHNIRPVSPGLDESNRGTEYFGLCPNTTTLCNGDNACICGDFFQPPKASRGAVARAWLYMQLRYPDLSLSLCHLEQLLAWHLQYLPTQEEIERNGVVCEQWQGNRNPYIDFPDLAIHLRLHQRDCPIDVTFREDTTPTTVGTATNIVGAEESGLRFGNLPSFDGGGNGGFAPGGDDLEDVATREGLWGNVFEPTADGCAELATGDIYFYVLQSSPSRIGFFPLVDLPKGLTLYLADSLSFATPAVARVAEDVPQSPLIQLELPDDIAKGNPFGYGLNLLYGQDWDVVTQALRVRGDAIGGDELFLFCYDQEANFHLISALTTNGSFRDESNLVAGTTGMVVLNAPMDYYVYNGPYYSSMTAYQASLSDASNWLGFDLMSPYQSGNDEASKGYVEGEGPMTNIESVEQDSGGGLKGSGSAAAESSSAATTTPMMFVMSLLLMGMTMSLR